MSARKGTRAAWAWAVALPALAGLAWLAACLLGEERATPADDAYITYVYGRNVAEGHGLVYNATDAEPTSGASSLLHVALAALLHAGGVDPLLGSRALCLLAFLSIPLAVAWAARALRSGPDDGARTPLGVGLAAGACVGLGLAFLEETAGHLADGMETMLFAGLHAWVAAWAVRAALHGAAGDGPSPGARAWVRGAGGAALLAAFSLARPEGFPLAGATLVAAGLAAALLGAGSGGQDSSGPGTDEGPARRALRAVGPAGALWLVVLAGYAVWKLATFGRLPSNPYYVKTHNAIFGGDAVALPGLRTTVRFFGLRALPLLGLVAAAAAFASRRDPGREPERARTPGRVLLAAAVLLAPSLGMAAAYARVIHEMAGGFRYEYPLLVPLAVAGGLALVALARRAPAAMLVPGLGLGLAAPLLFAPADARFPDWLSAPGYSALRWTSFRNTELAHARLGLDLRDTGLGQDATILLSGAGMVPYFSRFRAIDWVGLNDNRLCGREALSIDEVWDYLEAQEPDLVFSIFPPASPGATGPDDDPVFANPLIQATLDGRASALFRYWDRDRLAEMFHREMRTVRDTCEFGAAYRLGDGWGTPWWILVYVRRDSPHRDALLERFATSGRADRDGDLAATYGLDPRALGRP